MSEKQYVVFKLNSGEYGIDIMNVKEISPYEESTPLPNTPKFMEGVINYRGSVIPIINLKKRFSLGEFEHDKDTRIIVINLNDREIGFVVDEASQTVRLNDTDIDPAPEMTSDIDERYITGVGKLDDKRLLVLIDLNKVLSREEVKEIENLKV